MEPQTLYSFDEAVLAQNNTSANEGGDIAIQYGTGVKIVKADGADEGVAATVPIISHEIGQYYVYPNYDEIPKYTGPLYAGNYEILRDNLKEAGLYDMAKAYFYNSGKLSAACYRQELEMMHRSEFIAGYQLLDLQDYTGQNSSFVGMLDAFMDSKGLITPEEWRHFCSDEVILAGFEKYTLTEEEKMNIKVTLSCFNPLRDLSGHSIICTCSMDGKTYFKEELTIENFRQGTTSPGSFVIQAPAIEKASGRILLRLNVKGTPISNEYTLWIYKKNYELPDADIIFSDGDNFIPGFYCSDFWNYTMFRQISESVGKPVATGTLGLIIDREHPALKYFDCETYETPQWYRLITGAKCDILDEYAKKGLRPIVQMIDNAERNHLLGILYELPDEEGNKRLICTIPKSSLLSCPQGRALLYSISRYRYEHLRPVF